MFSGLGHLLSPLFKLCRQTPFGICYIYSTEAHLFHWFDCLMSMIKVLIINSYHWHLWNKKLIKLFVPVQCMGNLFEIPTDKMIYSRWENLWPVGRIQLLVCFISSGPLQIVIAELLHQAGYRSWKTLFYSGCAFHSRDWRFRNQSCAQGLSDNHSSVAQYDPEAQIREVYVF